MDLRRGVRVARQPVNPPATELYAAFVTSTSGEFHPFDTKLARIPIVRDDEGRPTYHPADLDRAVASFRAHLVAELVRA